jgi:hypothetical protein
VSIPSPAFQEGRIMAPTDLSVGRHQLVATISDPSGGPPDVLESPSSSTHPAPGSASEPSRVPAIVR